MELEIFHGPQWFSGVDIFLDFFSAIILVIIAMFALRYFWIHKENKNHAIMFASLAMLAGSFLFKIITYYTVYASKYEALFFPKILAYSVNHPAFLFFFFMHVVLGLVGLLLLYSILEKNMSIKTFLLILTMMLILTFMSARVYPVFYITSFALTTLIAINLWRTFENNRLKPTMMLALSFTILALSRVFFLYTHVHSLVYLAAEILQFSSYIILLLALTMVLKHAKKKR